MTYQPIDHKKKADPKFEAENEPEKLSIPEKEFVVMEKESETKYKLIGLHAFFDTEDDKNINWEDYFGLK